MGGRFWVLHPHVRDRERHIDEPHPELEREFVLRIGCKDRTDGRCHAAVEPGDRHTLIIEPRFDPLDGNGVIIAVAEVVLSRPRELDRSSIDGLAAKRRLQDIVGFGLAAEAAAKQRDIDTHLVLAKAKTLSQARTGRLGRLRARPGFAFSATHPRHRGRRLHRSLS